MKIEQMAGELAEARPNSTSPVTCCPEVLELLFRAANPLDLPVG